MHFLFAILISYISDCYLFLLKGSTEEQIKQELQAVAEGVAASVLQSSPPSNHDLSGPGRSESPSTIQQNSEVQSIDRGVLNVDKFDVSNSPSLVSLNPFC